MGSSLLISLDERFDDLSPGGVMDRCRDSFGPAEALNDASSVGDNVLAAKRPALSSSVSQPAMVNYGCNEPKLSMGRRPLKRTVFNYKKSGEMQDSSRTVANAVRLS